MIKISLIFTALVVFFVIILGLIVAIKGGQKVLAKYQNRQVAPTEHNPDNELDKPKPTRIRLKSLDTFRGWIF